MTNIRTAIGSLDLDESLSKRDEINAKVLVAVDQATHPWGIKVNRIELKDIQPPRDLVDSMARQMKAEREKRANVLEAEGFRQAAILKAEGEKQSVILEAEGNREAAFRARSARAPGRGRSQGDAARVRCESPAGNVQAINYFVAQKYIEAFKALAEAPNQKFVLMPMESAGVIGSLGGHRRTGEGRVGQVAAADAGSRELSHALGLAGSGVGGGSLGAVRPGNDGAGRLHAVAGLRGGGGVRGGVAVRPPGAGTGRAVRRAQLHLDPGLPALVPWTRAQAATSPCSTDAPRRWSVAWCRWSGAIVNGRGRVQIADAFWEVKGSDLAAGTPVRIVAVDGMSLRVEAA
jgi:hypothetical protein